MIIACPHCQARLNLPVHAAGCQVRCAVCRQVFGTDAPKESVQPGSPPKPMTYDEARPRVRTRRREDFDDYGDGPNLRGSPRESVESAEHAKALMRPAAYTMLAALVVTAVMVVGDAAIEAVVDPAGGALMGVCRFVLYTPMLPFIGMGAGALFTFGSRGMIVTAVVMNFILLLLLGGCEVLNVLSLGQGVLPQPAPAFVLWTGLALNGLAGLANLAAASMAIRVLTFREVAAAYAARAEEQWRRRY